MATEVDTEPQPAVETTAAPRQRTTKIGRWQIGLNVLIQVALVLLLAAMVNALAFRHYKRWDHSRDQKYALSDKTKRFLDTIKGKMRVTVFFSPNTPISTDVQNLLIEYQYASHGKIDVENIDPERNFSRAKEMFENNKVVAEESLIVIDYKEGKRGLKPPKRANVAKSARPNEEGQR